MKTYISIICIIAVSLTILGCVSAPQPNPHVEQSTAMAMGECYKASVAGEDASIAKLSDPKDVLIYKAFHELGKAANKSGDPCRVTTNNDLQRIAMEEQTKQVSAGMEAFKVTAGSVVTGVLGWKALDVLPSIFDAAGASYSISAGNDISLTDSLKTSSFDNIVGDISIGDVLSNPSTSEEVVFAPE